MLVPLIAPLEAILFAAGSNGLGLEEISAILQVSIPEAQSLCMELQSLYDERRAGIRLVELAESFVLVTRAEHADYLKRMATSPTSTNLSVAALEVLAIVAYRQPITRAEVELTRGVQSDRAISTLTHRQLIKEVGRQDGPGRPILYGTTENFLQTFGLRSLADLPPLPDEPLQAKDLSLFQMTSPAPRD